MTESRYIEKRGYLSKYSHERTLARREPEFDDAWFRAAREDFPRFVPYIIQRCGVVFRGRVLEFGAGGAWLSAELSKLPTVVEVTAIDWEPRALRDHAPKVFDVLKANKAKITRMPGDVHQLDFPANHFDFVVCSAVLHQAPNLVQALREIKRVLKPGGKFVAIREPICPLVKLKTRARAEAALARAGIAVRFYTLADYKEHFKQAGLPVEAWRVNLSGGFKYYVNKIVNGLTHARYAFVGTKRGRG